MKLSQLLFGTVSFALLFGSAGYFHGEQMKTDAVSPLKVAKFIQADVFDFKSVDVIEMAEVVLFKSPKFDVNFVISENEINRVNEFSFVVEENTKTLAIDLEFLTEFSAKFILSKMEKTPSSLLSLKACEKAVKKSHTKKTKNVCPQKKINKRDRLKRFKKSASWI